MDHTAYMAYLMDFYGPMLTGRQKQVMHLRVEEDLTLGEIAQELGISRQAVHEGLRRAEALLVQMEEKLHLAARYQAVHTAARQALGELDRGDTQAARRTMAALAKEGDYGV